MRDNSQRYTSAIGLQIAEIINNHFRELESFVGVPLSRTIQVPEAIIHSFSELILICNEIPSEVSFEDYHDACRYLNEINDFLRVFSQEQDVDFEDTELGRLIVQTMRWCKEVSKKYQYSLDDVWNKIAPSVPDHITMIDYDVYEAQWWHPVPMMDVEILKRTEGIDIVSTLTESKNIQGGLSVRFKLSHVSGEGR